jgi:PAS domain S-box-containing protein
MGTKDLTLSTPLRIGLLIVATICAIFPSIFSLTNGIYEVFPFLYFIPIILVVYFFPRYSVLYSLAISITYISLIYYYGSSNPNLIAISTGWFAIFIVIGVVASSYANLYRDENEKIRKVFEAAQDGMFCFDKQTRMIREINPMCARMLRYEREELIGKEISVIWSNSLEIEEFITDIRDTSASPQREILLTTKDGGACRCIISAILSRNNLVLCSAFDITSVKTPDEEIRQTLEDLDKQVRERTAHLEKINEDLKAEILARRRFERDILSGGENYRNNGGGK